MIAKQSPRIEELDDGAERIRFVAADGTSEPTTRDVASRYTGNNKETAALLEADGYKITPREVAGTMRAPSAGRILRERGVPRGVATRVDLQRFFTRTMLDAAEGMQHRLRAAELLGKTLGAFIDRVDVTSAGVGIGEIMGLLDADLAERAKTLEAEAKVVG